ncbi:MAG TPA: ABC transporter permease subunit [Acidimicrobiia bacterium]|nr:ABC transporter permease subunit [Acidimicrobiia bacterium]
MLRNPFTKWLWDARRSILGWSVAVAAVGSMYASFWPTFDDPEMQELIANYPSEIMEALNYTEIASAAGYLNATVYGLIVAMLMVVYAVSSGTRMIAGDEEAGTLDLILVHPVGRIRVALERYLAFVVSVAVISLVLLIAILAISVPVKLTSIPIENLVAMHLHLVFFGALFGAVTFAVGTASGSRVLALSIGAGVAVLGFAANGVLRQIEGLEWTENLSPFDWLNGSAPLTNGVHITDLAIMGLCSIVLVGFGLWAFDRRDVGV